MIRILLGLGLLVTHISFGAIAHVQSTSVHNTTNNATVAATLNGVASGNFLIALIVEEASTGRSITGVSDGTTSLTATTNSPVGTPGTQGLAWIYYLANSPSGNRTVTVTFSGNSTAKTLWLLEFSGVDNATPLETDNNFIQSAMLTTTVDAPSISTTTNGCLIIVVVRATVSGASGGGFTSLNEHNTNLAQYKIQASAGTVQPNFLLTDLDMPSDIIAAFKPADGGGGSPAFIPINNPMHY